MKTECQRITFDMIEDDNKRWQTVIDLVDNVQDVDVSTYMLVETGQEEIVIRILRRTSMSMEYASSVKSMWGNR